MQCVRKIFNSSYCLHFCNIFICLIWIFGAKIILLKMWCPHLKSLRHLRTIFSVNVILWWVNSSQTTAQMEILVTQKNIKYNLWSVAIISISHMDSDNSILRQCIICSKFSTRVSYIKKLRAWERFTLVLYGLKILSSSRNTRASFSQFALVQQRAFPGRRVGR